MPSIERPLIKASAPPHSEYRPVTRRVSEGPVFTAAGIAAMSSSVPSMSRNQAQRGSKGGRPFTGSGRPRPAPSGARAGHHAPAVAHARSVDQHAPGPAEDIELLHQVAHA